MPDRGCEKDNRKGGLGRACGVRALFFDLGKISFRELVPR